MFRSNELQARACLCISSLAYKHLAPAHLHFSYRIETAIQNIQYFSQTINIGLFSIIMYTLPTHIYFSILDAFICTSSKSLQLTNLASSTELLEMTFMTKL